MDAGAGFSSFTRTGEAELQRGAAREIRFACPSGVKYNTYAMSTTQVAHEGVLVVVLILEVQA